jgi:hypothetical protein
MFVSRKKRNALRENDWTSALVTPTRTAQQIINGIPHGVQRPWWTTRA